MHKRKIVSGILATCIFVLSFVMTSTVEASTTDVNIKAQVLNRLGMLTGDGKGNYNLTLALKRSEAATFIVKLMGKSDYLEENKAQYINTGFADVTLTNWYAAYVGYCKENGIISGIGQNKFGPNTNVTEKAFLTMTMKVLGYTDEDFNWGSVYQKAYEIGLVTDDKYKDKTDDNKEYTRAEVVKVMYQALGLKNKGTDTSLFKQFLIDGKITPEKASETGIPYDEQVTTASAISVKSSDLIQLEFNEPINALKDSDILIYDTASKAILSSKISYQSDTQLKIKTGDQKAGVNYSAVFSNIYDKQYGYVKEIKSEFIGYENKEIKSDLFKISKVEQSSANEIIVYFTHPVNINAEQPNLYSLLTSEGTVVEGNKSKLSVKVIEGKTNAVIIDTKDYNFKADEEYTLKINGSLISAYGTRLGSEAGDQVSFLGKAIPAEQFKLIGITPLSNKSIQLNFNKQISETTAKQVYSYYITETVFGTPMQISTAMVVDNTYGKNCAVILTTANILDSTKIYNIMINNVSDVTKQFKIEEQSFTFNSIPMTISDFRITSADYIDSTCILLTFNKDINADMAEDINNYSLDCKSNTTYTVTPVKAIYSSDSPKAVKLYFSYAKPMTKDYYYLIRVSPDFTDYAGNKPTLALEYSFISKNIIKTKPEVVKAVFIAKDTIKVDFNQYISLDSPNILTGNYCIQTANEDETKKVPIAINYIDEKTIVLKFDNIESAGQYYFKYNEIKDITGETYSGNQAVITISQGQ
jgi:hypothetical protein